MHRPLRRSRRTAAISTFVALIVGVLQFAPSSAAPAIQTIRAFGDNSFGQLGDGTLTSTSTPVSVRSAESLLEDAVQVAAGDKHSVVLTDTGEVWAWGSNDHGQLAVSPASLARSTAPVRVAIPGQIRAIAAAGSYSLALGDKDASNTGFVWMWGSITAGTQWEGANFDAVRGCPANIITPTLVNGLSSITELSAGSNHALAVQPSGPVGGRVLSWGTNDRGELGDGTVVPSVCQSRTVLSVDQVVDVGAGSVHSLALRSDGSVYAWGGNTNGQIGDSTNIDRPTPVPVQVRSQGGLLTPFVGAVQVAAGDRHSIARVGDKVWTWGANERGQLGLGDTTSRTVPNAVPATSGLSSAQTIAGGGAHTVALSGNSVWTWGSNLAGQLGRSGNTNLPGAASGIGGSGSTSISAGGSHTLSVVAPKLDVSSSALTFADRLIGTSSAAQTLTLSNAGPGRIAFGSLDTGSNQFALASDACSGASIPAGGSCKVTITFSPTLSGSHSTCLTIPANTFSVTSLPTSNPCASSVAGDFAGLVSLVGSASPVPGPVSGGKIAFSSNRNGSRDLLVMNVDGTGLRTLTSGAGDDKQPSWHPQGTALTYVRNATPQTASGDEIYTIGSNGGTPTRLTNNTAIDTSPEWSPAGDKIAFASDRGNNLDIYVMNADGANPIKLTTDGVPDTSPTWSPDGAQIAFVHGTGDSAEIRVMNADGTNVRTLTTNVSADTTPSWSPDGTRIAFVSKRDGNAEIYVMNADGANEIRKTTNVAADSAPAWSPDGSTIVFSTDRDGNTEIYSVNIAGSPLTNLTSASGGDFEPAWVDNLTLTSGVRSIAATPPQVPSNDVLVHPGAPAVQDAGAKLIDGIGAKLIDGIGAKLIDGIGLKLIDGIGAKLIDGIGLKLIDGIGAKLIDGIGLKLIDGIGAKLIDGIGTASEDAAVAATLKSISLDSLRSTVGDPIESKFVGTIHEGKPAQALTLYDYFWCINKIDSCRVSGASETAAEIKNRLVNTSLFGIDYSSSKLADINLLSILTADVPVKNIPGPNWCDGMQKQGQACDLNATLMQLQLRGINLAPFFAISQPDGGTSLNGVTLGSVTFKNVSGAAVDSPIKQIRLEFIDMYNESFGKIVLNDIPAATRGNVVDCSAFDCTKTLYQAQSQKKADGTNYIKDTADVGDLGSAASSFALGDFALSLVTTLGQEQLPYEVYAAGYENPSLGTTKLTQTFTHAPVGVADVNPIVKVTLPAYWSYVSGSAQVNVLGQREPSVKASSTSTILEWDLEDLTVPASQLLQITYQVRPWLGVGLQTSSAIITTAAINERIEKRAPVQVTPSNETNDTPEQACAHPIQSGFAYFSQIERRGDRDFFCIPAPPANSTLNVSLRNVGSNNQLVLYHPKDGQRPAPLSNMTVSEPAILGAPDTGAGTALSGEPVAPDTHNEIQMENLPVAGISDNKGLAPESISARTWTTRGSGPHYYLVQISGAVGEGGAEFSDLPYTLSYSITGAPGEISCPPRSLSAASPPTPSVAPTALELQGKKSLLLVNRERLYGEFGLTAGNDAMAALNAFVASPAGQAVGAAVFTVDGFADVKAAYAGFDSAPCNVEAMREVPRAINRAMTSVTAPMQIENIAIIGSPLQIPYGAVEDRTFIANEALFGVQSMDAAGAVDMTSAITSGNILTDSVYLGRAVPWGGDWLYLPTASVGRVTTEKGSDVAAAMTQLSANAGWDPGASLATGYDFFADAGRGVDSIFHKQRPNAPQSSLLNETWSGNDLRQMITSLAPTKTFASVNAHFSPFLMQPAGATSVSDLFTPQQLLDNLSLNLWGYGTVGCHSLLSVPNAYASANNIDKVTDWVESWTAHGAQWGVGQTAFGLGVEGSTALSEKLLVDFASYLDGRMTVGQARASSIWDYFSQAGSFAEYDRKSMMSFGETGFSWIKVGAGDTVAPKPAAALQTDPATGLKIAKFSADFQSDSVWNKQTTSTGSFYELNGNSQSTPGRPTQPLAIFDANSGVTGLRPHGVLFVPLKSGAESINPAQGGVTYGAASAESQSQVTFPAAPAQVHRLDTPYGPRDQVAFVAGRFRPNATLTDGQVLGEQTRWLNSQLITSYSTSNDFTPPVASSIIATQLDASDPSSVTFVVTSPSPDVARVVISYLVKGTAGEWKTIDLKQVGGIWVGSPFIGDEVLEFFTQLQDTSGNWGLNTNEGDFHREILPPIDIERGAVDINIQGTPGRNGWYVDPVSIAISSPSTGVGFETSLNGGEFVEDATIDLFNSGVYTIDFRASDRSAAGTIVIRLDLDNPTASITSPLDTAVFEVGSTGTKIAFSCSDDTSRIDTCVGTGPQGSVKNGDPVYTGAPGEYTIDVLATDLAGRTASAVVHYTVVDTTAPGITIINPFDGENFLLNQATGTNADYFCTDVGVILTCIGTAKKPDGSQVAVADGGRFPTDQAGRYEFTVKSSDSKGNTASKTNVYTVGYNFTFLEPPSSKNKTNAGQQIPISWTIHDANGVSVVDRSAILYMASYQIDPVTGERRSVDESYPVSAIKLTDTKYQFGWSSKSEWAGTTRRFYVRTKDLSEHPLTFDFIR